MTAAKPTALPSSPHRLLQGRRDVALFVDFDGTLAEIVEHPDAVNLEPGTRRALRRLQSTLDGALAVITGRDIADVDTHLAPLRLAVAGVHGLARRTSNGEPTASPAFSPGIESLATALSGFAASHPGIHLEVKSAAVALHFRARPELESEALAAMEAALRGIEGFQILRGKMVVEAKPANADKGQAVNEFMAETPFGGRLPVFAGDDVTDEAAFAVVNARGGVSIKVGQGDTSAGFRVATTAEFIAWLAALADYCEASTVP